MSTWDVFHSDRLEVERGLDDDALRAASARGDLLDDDLIRPAGSGSPWERLGDRLDLLAPSPVAPASARPVDRPGPEADGDFEEVAPEDAPPPLFEFADEPEPEPEGDDGLEILDDDSIEGAEADEAADLAAAASAGPILPPLDKSVAIPVPGPAPLPWDEQELEVEFGGEDEYDPLDEDEAAGEFTLARGSAQTVEELDLAAMVDVAFQLVLFFLVTATTVFYKSLEVPKPNADAPPDAVQQGRAKTLDEMMSDAILVEIAPDGTYKIDRQPVADSLTRLNLVDKLRKLRTDTGRQTMLLAADYNTPHRLAVIALDAANEIGMGIKEPAPPKPAASNAPPPARKG